METMAKHGIAVPDGHVAKTPEEAEHIFTNKLSGGSSKDVVIKAQVLSGGRGLGTFKNGFKGGVHMVTRKEEAHDFAKSMLGQELVTKQNAQGILCEKVYLMERIYMRRELYLSILMDRASDGPLLVASPFGGTSIEDVAASNPDAIFTLPIDVMSDELGDDVAATLAATGRGGGGGRGGARRGERRGSVLCGGSGRARGLPGAGPPAFASSYSGSGQNPGLSGGDPPNPPPRRRTRPLARPPTAARSRGCAIANPNSPPPAPHTPTRPPTHRSSASRPAARPPRR
jgi:hypothetical protein